MNIDVSNALMHPGQEYRFQGLQAIADQEIYNDIVSIDDCAVTGTYMADDDGNVSVEGVLKTSAHAPCANCLSEATVEVENDFNEVFVRNGNMEDDEIFAYEGHVVDLEKMIMSYTVMALPIRFLCKEDCPGLQYSDRDFKPNQDPNVQYPFAALKDLLNHNEEV